MRLITSIRPFAGHRSSREPFMSTKDGSSRRHFLEALGALTAGGLVSAQGAAGEPARGGVPDPPRELKPSGADLGSLFADVNRLAEGVRYDYSFLAGRFRDLDDFKKTARAKVFEL